MPAPRRSSGVRIRVAVGLALYPLVALHAPIAGAAPRTLAAGAFAFDLEVTVAGTPEQAFEAFTAETIQWWDHTFSEKPLKLAFEPRPGGGFVEIFDAQGNGAWHATVIYAERPKMMRFVGPLGLSGKALDMAHTLTFAPAPDGGTSVRLELHASGEMEEGWPGVVESVWQHFLVERFKPYMAARRSK